MSRPQTTASILPILFTALFAIGCKSVIERQDVRPRVLRDVPARNLAYRLIAGRVGAERPRKRRAR